MTEVESFLILNMIDGLGPSRLKALLDHFGSPEKVLLAPRKELLAVHNIGKECARNIIAGRVSTDIKKELDLIERNRVKIVTIFDKSYPKNLKEIFDPPILLYVKGQLRACDFAAIAIVGSRRASYYGQEITQRISYDLAQKGVTIVSGMARGVDTAAHRGAIKGKGRTIAVWGSGLDVVYPPENARLADDIATCGALVSEFPMQTPPYKENFPRRNRIISGLSLGVLVVEAAQRSGALITAGFALEQGREVFAVPGRAGSFTSKGTHNLIKEGAKLVETSEDIMEELRPIFKMHIKDIEVEVKTEPPLSIRPKLEKEEKIIYETLSDEPTHIDKIAASSGLPISQVLSGLTRLEIRKLVKELPGKMFVKMRP